MSVLLSSSVSESLSVSSELESMLELSEESSSMTTSASIHGAFAGGSAALLVRHLERNFWQTFSIMSFFSCSVHSLLLMFIDIKSCNVSWFMRWRLFNKSRVRRLNARFAEEFELDKLSTIRVNFQSLLYSSFLLLKIFFHNCEDSRLICFAVT